MSLFFPNNSLPVSCLILEHVLVLLMVYRGEKRRLEVSVSLTQSSFSCYDGSGLGLMQLSVHLRTSCSSTCLIARNDKQTLQAGRLLLTGLCFYKAIRMERLKIKPSVYNSRPVFPNPVPSVSQQCTFWMSPLSDQYIFVP